MIPLKGYLKPFPILNAILLVRPMASSMISFSNSFEGKLKNKVSKSKENAKNLIVDEGLNALGKNI